MDSEEYQRRHLDRITAERNGYAKGMIHTLIVAGALYLIFFRDCLTGCVGSACG